MLSSREPADNVVRELRGKRLTTLRRVELADFCTRLGLDNSGTRATLQALDLCSTYRCILIYPGYYMIIGYSSVSVVCVPIIHYIITKQAHVHSNQTHMMYYSILG